MSNAHPYDRRPLQARSRRLELASRIKRSGLALAMASGLVLAACQPQQAHKAQQPPPPPPPPPKLLTADEIGLALGALKAAPDQGFAADRFPVERIQQLLQSANSADQAAGRKALRATLVDYARAEHGETIPRGAFPKDWGLKPEPYDAAAALDQAVQAGTFKDWLASQPPPLPAYQALQKAYVSYAKAAADGGWPIVSPGDLTSGAHGRRIRALRKRLAAEDAQLADTPVDAPADDDLIAALQSFQTAQGLPATGQLDAATAAALDAPPEARAEQLRVNLERLRWLPRQTPPTRIEVNTAATEMDYYQDGQLAIHMLAAGGKPGDETPMLRSTVSSVVLNPPWNVPKDIARKEILRKGRGYLRSHGFYWKGGRLVQRPGPKAALGVVKFDFPNPYAVYLHDTPSKAAFHQTQRTVSHGCVRLAQATDLAKTLLSQQGWSPERVDQTIADRRTTYVTLNHPVPVRLIYLTAYPSGDFIAFRPDVYGWDAELRDMLDKSTVHKPGQAA